MHSSDYRTEPDLAVCDIIAGKSVSMCELPKDTIMSSLTAWRRVAGYLACHGKARLAIGSTESFQSGLTRQIGHRQEFKKSPMFIRRTQFVSKFTHQHIQYQYQLMCHTYTKTQLCECQVVFISNVLFQWFTGFLITTAPSLFIYC